MTYKGNLIPTVVIILSLLLCLWKVCLYIYVSVSHKTLIIYTKRDIDMVQDRPKESN